MTLPASLLGLTAYAGLYAVADVAAARGDGGRRGRGTGDLSWLRRC